MAPERVRDDRPAAALVERAGSKRGGGTRSGLALEHAEDRSAEQHGVARRRRELGPPALAQAADHGGAQVRSLSRQPDGAALT
jgi:hypothetical protein